MSIEELWRLAVEEFGDRAHERFLLRHKKSTQDKWHDVTTNGVMPSDSSCVHYDFKLKPIPALISHDIETYGDKAYLMWELCDARDLLDAVSMDSPESLATNAKLCLDNPCILKLNRKKSAALPFDLERAQAGDVLEFTSAFEFCPAKFISFSEASGLIEVQIFCRTKVFDGYIDNVSPTYRHDTEKDLRMKYPKAIK